MFQKHLKQQKDGNSVKIEIAMQTSNFNTSIISLFFSASVHLRKLILLSSCLLFKRDTYF